MGRRRRAVASEVGLQGDKFHEAGRAVLVSACSFDWILASFLRDRRAKGLLKSCARFPLYSIPSHLAFLPLPSPSLFHLRICPHVPSPLTPSSSSSSQQPLNPNPSSLQPREPHFAPGTLGIDPEVNRGIAPRWCVGTLSDSGGRAGCTLIACRETGVQVQLYSEETVRRRLKAHEAAREIL